MIEVSAFELLRNQGDLLETFICESASEFGSIVYTYAEVWEKYIASFGNAWGLLHSRLNESEFGKIEPEVEYESKVFGMEASSLTPPDYICFPTISGVKPEDP